MATDKSVREILIKVVANGSPELKALADSMSTLNKTVSDMSGGFSTLGKVLGGIAGYFSVRQIVEYADAMQLLRNRITAIEGSGEKAAQVMGDLLSVANRTKMPMESVSEVYARLGVALKEANLSSETLAGTTEVLLNTFRIAGSNEQEAANAVVQFSQALSLGVLRGQDFKSVLSQNAELGNVLVKVFGVDGRGALQKMAEAGELTSKKVMVALVKAMDDVNGRAAKMSSTIGQTLTLVMNDFKKSIDEVNSRFDVSGKFAKGVETMKEKFTLFLAVITTIAVSAIPSLIASLGGVAGIITTIRNAILGLAVALRGLTASNIIVLAATAVGAAVLYLAENLDQAQSKMKQYISQIEIWYLKAVGFFESIAGKLGKTIDPNSANERAQRISAIEEEIKAEQRRYEEFKKIKNAEGKANYDAKKMIDEINKGLKDGEIDKRARLLKQLNTVAPEKIDVAEYFRQLDSLDRQLLKVQFKEGKLDLEQYQDKLNKLDFKDLNRELITGKRNFSSWNEVIRENKVARLKDDLDAGKISLTEFDAEVVKIKQKFDSGSAFRSGISDYIKDIKTLNEGIAGLVKSTFDKLEEKLFEFVSTGKTNFADLAKFAVQELNKIIFRAMVMQPLANAVLGSFGVSSATATETTSVGGVSGGTGMALSGPTRTTLTGSGVYGSTSPSRSAMMSSPQVSNVQAPVYVSITNNSNGEVQQSQSVSSDGTRFIDVVIENKVKEGLARGTFDRTLQQAYGIKRRGN